MTKSFLLIIGVAISLMTGASAYAQSPDRLPRIKIEANCLKDNSCGKILSERYNRAATKAELYCYEELLRQGYLEREIQTQEPCRQLAVDKAKRSQNGINKLINDIVDDWNKADEVQRRAK